jgi:hypothetical protein
MKVHKITQDKIFFMMDSGAYGSIDKRDVAKLVTAASMPEQSIDSRREACIIQSFFKKK